MLIATMKFSRELTASAKVYKLACRVWPDFQAQDAKIRLTLVIGNELDSPIPISGLSAFFPYAIEDGSIHYINRVMVELSRTDPRTSAPTKLIELDGKPFFSEYDGISQVAVAEITCQATNLEFNCSRMDIHFESSLPPGGKYVFFVAFRARGIFTFDKLLSTFSFTIMRLSDLGYKVGTAQLSEDLEIPWLKVYTGSDPAYNPGGVNCLLQCPTTHVLGNVSSAYTPGKVNQRNWLGEASTTKYQSVIWSPADIMNDYPDVMSAYFGKNGIKIAGTLARVDMMVSNYRRGEVLAIIGIVLAVISLVISLFQFLM